MTFDEELQEITFIIIMSSWTLSFSLTPRKMATHPAAGILFGKFNTAGYEILIDEVRYSEGILDSSLFLKAATWAPSPFEITTFNFNQEENLFTLEWRSEPGVFYSVDRWDDIINEWENLKMPSFQRIQSCHLKTRVLKKAKQEQSTGFVFREQSSYYLTFPKGIDLLFIDSNR